MIDRLIREYMDASDEEREAFHKQVGQCGVSAENIKKAVDTLSEIARDIENN